MPKYEVTQRQMQQRTLVITAETFEEAVRVTKEHYSTEGPAASPRRISTG